MKADAACHGIDYEALKDLYDSTDVEMDSFEHEILTTVREDSDEDSFSELSDMKSEAYTTYDYLNKIEDPSDEELEKIENCYLPNPYDDEIDDTRRDYFDYVHADEPESACSYSREMNDDAFKKFLKSTPLKYHWVYQMYHAIDSSLAKMGTMTSEIVAEKYGLSNGIRQTNKMLAENIKSIYGVGNTAKVAAVLKEALECIRENEDLRPYVNKTREELIDDENEWLNW